MWVSPSLPPCDLLARESPKAPQTIKAADTAVVVWQNYPTAEDTAHSVGRGEIKLELNWKTLTLLTGFYSAETSRGSRLEQV